MMIKFTCKCGNTDPKKSFVYDGALGYEASVCLVCGRYSDYNGSYEPDEWSKELITAINEHEEAI